MKVQQCAEAILLASRNKSEDTLERVVANTVAILKDRGHIALLPRILDELERLISRTEESQECVVRTATTSDAERFAQEIEKDVVLLQAESLSRVHIVDETLIGGYELRANGKRIDRSHKHALTHLYNTLLTNQ